MVYLHAPLMNKRNMTLPNLIIQSGESSFRVYRGILSSASSMFRDMLSLAVTDEEQAIDGCPVVHVSDPAADISFFLRSLHDTEFFLPPPARTTFAATAGVLRLSTKYDVPFLRRRALRHLSIIYPTLLSDWTPPHQWLSSRVEDHFSAIQLAREFDIPWIRPMAIYTCMSKPASSEFHDVFQKANLSHEDRRICIIAMRRLKACEVMCIVPFLGDMPKCTFSSPNCKSKLRASLAHFENHEGADPLVQTNTILDTFGFCANCSALFRVWHSSQRIARWNTMPAMFQCPSWEDLETLRTAALA